MIEHPMIGRARVRLHAYRQLGPRRGTVAAALLIEREGRTRMRRLILARRPLRATQDDLRIALGGAIRCRPCGRLGRRCRL